MVMFMRWLTLIFFVFLLNFAFAQEYWNGNWEGTAANGMQLSGSWNGEVTNNRIQGDVIVVNPSGLPTGTISGDWSSSQISASVAGGVAGSGQTIQWSGTVSGNTASGNWILKNSYGDTIAEGTWTGHKLSNTVTPVCGNNIIEDNEECDGTDLQNKDCTTFGYTQGTLKCSSYCSLDTSECHTTTNPPNNNPKSCCYTTAFILALVGVAFVTGKWNDK